MTTLTTTGTTRTNGSDAQAFVGAAPTGGPGGGSLPAWIHRAWAFLSRPLVQDILMAAVLTALGIIGVFAHLEVELPEGGGVWRPRHMDVIGISLILLQTLPLIWRRRFPVVVLGITAAAMVSFFIFGYFLSFAAFGFLVALYTVASIGPRSLSIPIGVATGALVVASSSASREPFEVDALIAEGLVVAAAWFLGDALRIRRTQVGQLKELATRLEHEREQLARAAVARERRLIARELHDVIAHNVSVIAAQAGAAERVFETDPQGARSSLGSIKSTAREAMTEMRRLTGFLRTDSEGSTEWSPHPGIAELPTLLEQVRDAGVEVTLSVEGQPRPIPASLDLSAYRIVQEALTNVIKHAGHARTEVVIRYAPSSVELVVENEPNGAAPRGTNGRQPFGLLGMRERAALFGGSLDVGPAPRGGFVVRAVLPIDGVAEIGTDVEPAVSV